MDKDTEKEYYGNIFDEDPKEEKFKKLIDGFIKYLKEKKTTDMKKTKEVV